LSTLSEAGEGVDIFDQVKEHRVRDLAQKVADLAANKGFRNVGWGRTHFTIGSSHGELEYLEKRGIHQHPLAGEGCSAFGCGACAYMRADFRGGRWEGLDKAERGVHVTESGETFWGIEVTRA